MEWITLNSTNSLCCAKTWTRCSRCCKKQTVHKICQYHKRVAYYIQSITTIAERPQRCSWFPWINNYEFHRLEKGILYCLITSKVLRFNSQSNLKTSFLFLLQTYELILAKRPHRYDKLVLILEIISVLSPCTAECERDLSQMKQLKTAIRSTLTQNNLDNVMMLSLLDLL